MVFFFSSGWQQHRTTFCTLKHMRSSCRPAVDLDGGLRFDISAEGHGGGGYSGLVARGGRVRRMWTHIDYSFQLVIVGIIVFVVWVFGFVVIFLAIDTSAAHSRMAK